MKVKYFSDLHLDQSNMDFSNIALDIQGNEVDLIILAGDLAVYRNLLNNLAYAIPSHIPVLIVLGNHEFEEDYYDNVVTDFKNRFNLPNWHILQNESIILNGVRFLGTTLWSDLKINGDSLYEANYESASLILRQQKTLVKDINKPQGFRIWNADDMLQEFSIARKFLEDELNKDYNGKTVVITHFAPHIKSISLKYKTSGFWSSNLEDLVVKSDFWVHGHIHDKSDYKVGKCRVLSNPRGVSHTYNLSQNIAFDIYAMFEV